MSVDVGVLEPARDATGAPAIAQGILEPIGSQWLAVTGHIRRRFLITYRAPAALLARWLPAPFTVDARDGHGFVSVCALSVRGMGIAITPSWMRFENVELLYRIGVRHAVGGAERASFITLRSDVSARALALLGRRFSHYRPRRADLSYTEEGDAIAMSCASADGLGDATFTADVSTLAGSSPGSLFASADDASGFLLGMDHSAGDRPDGRVQVQPIEHSPWDARFVQRVSARFRLIDHLAARWGVPFEYDSTLHMENITQLWRATRCP